MQALNFPGYRFRFKNSENKLWIFDIIRKKYVVLQPEEWVRQHAVMYLIHTKQYPKSHINVEKQLLVNNLRKRYDIVVFNSDGTIKILVECKAPHIEITQQTFDQVARYNMPLRSEYLIITNGLQHYHCQMDTVNEKYSFLKEIPDFGH